MLPVEKLILELLGESTLAGSDLREQLGKHGFPMSGPTFYSRMATLEDEQHVEGFWCNVPVAGQVIKKRFYRAASAT